MRCLSRQRIFLKTFEILKMRKSARLLVFLCLTGAASFAYADYELLVKSNCLACHAIDKRKYGPTLNAVASKYANDSKAVEKLAKKIKIGGKGVWGEDMMPPQPSLSKADALTLAKYVLSLK
jgi:cytochrome c